MKQISMSELKVGDIFTKEMKLHGREAFEVIDAPLTGGFIIVKSRSIGGENKRMRIGSVPYVTLLIEADFEF